MARKAGVFSKRNMMEMLERDAREYRADAVENLRLSARMHNMTEADMKKLQGNPVFAKRVIDAVLTGFITTVGRNQGLDWDIKANHLREY